MGGSTTALLASLVLVSSCVLSPTTSDGVAGFALTEGTPEALGVIAFLNDEATSFELLDDEVGLDRRAAQNLVAHRDGPDGVVGTADDDLFDRVAEIDAISWVGPTALRRILEHAEANGWVAEDEDYLGSFDGVAFSPEEAEATLDLANRGARELLDDEVGLDRRAVEAIVEARPIETMEELAALSYVGPSALDKMKQYALDNGYGSDDSPPDSWPPPQVSPSLLVEEARVAGSSSEHFDRMVALRRAIVTSAPRTVGAGNSMFHVADPASGWAEELLVYIAATASIDTSSVSLFDDLELFGTFTEYGGTFELLLDETEGHSMTQNRSGLEHEAYESIQAAYHSTSANPEGAVRIRATFGYTFMVPLPQVLDHPMWDGESPGPPHDSGDEQDYNWNRNAQRALDAWHRDL